MVLIAVHGSASRLLPAERGTVHLALELEHDDRATALQQVAELHARFRAEAEAFVANGTATWWGSDQVWVRPDVRWEGEHPQRRTVQVATARVHVRFQDFTALSTWILDAGSVLGVTIPGIDWTVTRTHEQEVEREMRVEAVRDAVARAEAYASAIGGSAVELQAVWEAGLRPVPSASPSVGGWRAQSMARKGEPGIELRPDDIEIRAEVTADFLVGAAG
jgi:uncharacterized protein YggE